jgi:membrane-associated phospholipid phosphatase
MYTIEPVTVKRRETRLGLYLAEWVVLLSAIVCYGLYDFLGVPFHNLDSMFLERAGSLFSYYLLALPLTLLVLRLRHLRVSKREGAGVPPIRTTWEHFRARFLTMRSLLLDFRALLLCVILFIVFIELKHLTPFLRSTLFDNRFINHELRLMGGGKLASEAMLALVGYRLAPLLSEGYFLFYPYVAMLIYLFVLQRDVSLRAEFLLGLSLCWLIGVLLIYLVPTLGPVFVLDSFNSLPETGVSVMQEKLLRMRESVLAGRGGVYLISGFPSLHVAITAYGTGMLYRLSPWLSLISLLVLALTLVTTLYFGWHYLMDDIGGLVLGFGVAVVVRRYFRPFTVLRRVIHRQQA